MTRPAAPQRRADRYAERAADVLIVAAALLSPEDTATRREELDEVLNTTRLVDRTSRPVDRFASAFGLAWGAAVDRTGRTARAGTAGLVGYGLAVIHLAFGLALFTTVAVVTLTVIGVLIVIGSGVLIVATIVSRLLLVPDYNPDFKLPPAGPQVDEKEYLKEYWQVSSSLVRWCWRFCFPSYLPDAEPWWRRPPSPEPAVSRLDRQDG